MQNPGSGSLRPRIRIFQIRDQNFQIFDFSKNRFFEKVFQKIFLWKTVFNMWFLMSDMCFLHVSIQYPWVLKSPKSTIFQAPDPQKSPFLRSWKADFGVSGTQNHRFHIHRALVCLNHMWEMTIFNIFRFLFKKFQKLFKNVKKVEKSEFSQKFSNFAERG